MSEQAPLPVVTHIGIQGMAGYLIPTFLALCGVLLWLNPIDRVIYSFLALFLALGSWITSNLGGFFVGMLVGVVGGALAFAWTTDADDRSAGWFDGKPRMALPAGRLVLMLRLKGHAAPELEGRRGTIGSARLALPWVADNQPDHLAEHEGQGVREQEPSLDQTVGGTPTGDG